MTKPTTTIPISSIILDENIYPRKSIDPRRIGIFAENIRDGFKFDPIEIEPAPGKPGMYRMNRLGIPQDRIAKRLNAPQQTISGHLPKMAALPNPVNTDLSQGFTVPQVAEKHNWTEPMVWSQALVNKDDFSRFKALQWGIRTWDLWNWNDCDKRFGDEWPGRIPAQLVAHILYFLSDQDDLTQTGPDYL